MDTTAESWTQAFGRGKDALARGAWEEARRWFSQALEQKERAEVLEGLGNAAYRLDDIPAVFDAHERAYRLYRECGDHRGAARMGLALATEYADFYDDLAAADGWIQRSRRLLDGLGPSPEHGWLAFWEGFLALWAQNFALSSQRAAETAALGRSLGVLDLEMLGLALEGLSLVWQGVVPEGMRHMDEAITAAVAGELHDLTAVSVICCTTLYACNWVADYERAAQWAARVKAFSDRKGLDPLFSLCRLNHAPVHLWRGAWPEAEADLVAAIRALEATRPPYFMEGVAKLAELRRRQGRLHEAGELLAKAEPHPLALLVQATIDLDRDDPGSAANLIERFLRQITVEDRAGRVFADGIQLRAELARGRVKEAAGILADMEAVASHVQTLPLLASARLAAGLVASAEGDAERARRSFEDALDLFTRSGAPYEAGRTRVQLATSLCVAGRYRSAADELHRALATLRDLGAEPEAARAESLLQEVEALAEGRARAQTGPDGLTPREIEVLQLLAEGRSNQEIAVRLVLSLRTAERHISNIYVKLGLSGKVARAAAAAYAVSRRMGSASIL